MFDLPGGSIRQAASYRRLFNGEMDRSWLEKEGERLVIAWLVGGRSNSSKGTVGPGTCYPDWAVCVGWAEHRVATHFRSAGPCMPAIFFFSLLHSATCYTDPVLKAGKGLNKLIYRYYKDQDRGSILFFKKVTRKVSGIWFMSRKIVGGTKRHKENKITSKGSLVIFIELFVVYRSFKNVLKKEEQFS